MRSIFPVRFAAAGIALATLGLAWPASTSAAPITTPTGLAPGAHYRLAFETSATTQALSSDISTYNAFVNTVANNVPALAGLGPWSAIASTPSVDARDNTSTNPAFDAIGAPIYNLQNQLVAATNTALWSASNATPLANPLDVDETGATLISFVWTGTFKTGRAYTGADFPFNTGSLGVQFAEVGSSQNVNDTWIAYSNGEFHGANSVYAISGVLTVPVPEPGSLGLLLLATAGGLFVARSLVSKRSDGLSVCFWQALGRM